MRVTAIISIFLSLFVIAESRVTFPFSDVIQSGITSYSGDTKASFNCVDGCKVYVNIANSEGGITNGSYSAYVSDYESKLIKNFKDIAGDNAIEQKGLDLPPGAYRVKYNGDSNSMSYGSSSPLVFYAVSNGAPNIGTRVFVPKGETTIDNDQRFATFLSGFEALNFYNFRGSFPAGYPKIYAAGYDALGDLYEDTSCVPVYEARSQYNAEQSTLSVAAPIMTVDFGFVGKHSVSVKNQGNGVERHKSAVSSTVYMTPGFIGCPFLENQLYDSQNSGFQDSFTMIANSLDISAYNSAIETVSQLKLKVNMDSCDFHSSIPKFFRNSYGRGVFKVSLSWSRPFSSFGTPAVQSAALQLDFGTVKQSKPEAIKPHQQANNEKLASTTTETRDTTTSAPQGDWDTDHPAEAVDARSASFSTETEGFSIGWKWIVVFMIVGVVGILLYRRHIVTHQRVN